MSYADGSYITGDSFSGIRPGGGLGDVSWTGWRCPSAWDPNVIVYPDSHRLTCNWTWRRGEGDMVSGELPPIYRGGSAGPNVSAGSAIDAPLPPPKKSVTLPTVLTAGGGSILPLALVGLGALAALWFAMR